MINRGFRKSFYIRLNVWYNDVMTDKLEYVILDMGTYILCGHFAVTTDSETMLIFLVLSSYNHAVYDMTCV